MRFIRLQNAVLGMSLLAVAGFVANTMSPVARAQSAVTGGVSGTVSDATGGVIPGATVVVIDTATDAKQTVKTNAEGRYTVGLLKPGLYKITAAAESMKSDTMQVTVILGTTVPADIKVTPTGSNTVIEVTSTALPLVDTQNVALATTFNEEQIQELPTPGGDVTTVAFTAPGVVVNAGGAYGNFSSDGLPGISNLFVLNGFDNQDPFLNLNNSGSSNLTLGQGELAEATVVQNGYNSQYGRAAGAVINYTTKSGTNRFHGMADYNWNGTLLNSNGWFNEHDQILSGATNTRPHAVSNEWAANVGGPIIKDRLFFFSDYEGLHYVLPGSSGFLTFPSPQLQAYTMANVPAAAQSFYGLAFAGYKASNAYASSTPVTNGGSSNQDGNGALGCGLASYYGLQGTVDPLTGNTFGVNEACMTVGQTATNNINKEFLFTQRVDWNISDKHKIYGRYKMDHGSQPTSTSPIDPLFSALSIQPEYEGQFNDSYVISPTKTNVFVAAANWYTAYFGPVNQTASLAALPANFYPDNGYDGSGVNSAPGLPNEGVPYYLTQGRNVTQYQLEDDFSWIHGKHTLKFGANFRRDLVEDYDSQFFAIFPYLGLSSLGDFASGTASASSPWYGYNAFEQAFTSTYTAHLALYNLGAYFQDEYQVLPNLKLTLGVRIDRTGDPLCHGGCFGSYTGTFPNNPSQTGAWDAANGGPISAQNWHPFPGVQVANFQPRFGFNYGFGDRTELRGGAGIFSDLYPAGFLDGAIQNFPNYNLPAILTGVASTSGAGSLGAFAAAANAATQQAFASGGNIVDVTTALFDGGSATAVPFSPPSINAYFPGTFKVPQYAEYSMQLQHQVSKSDAFIITYAGNYGYDGVLINPWLNAGDGQFGNGFNGIPIGTWATPGATFGNLSPTPPDPRFGKVSAYTNNGHSNYNGALFTYKHSGHGLTGELSYTYSHSLDMVSNGGEGEPFNGGALTAQLTPSLGRGNLNYSNSDYDVRNNLTGDAVYEEPFKSGNRILNEIAGGWVIGAKTYWRSGEPYSITNGLPLGNFPNSGGTLTAALAPGVTISQLKNLSTSNAHAGAYGEPTLDITQFVSAGAQSNFGTLRRNALPGPHYVDTDMNVMKKVVKTEGLTLKLGINAYNLFNDVNFGSPASNVQYPGSFGQIFGALAPPTSPYGSFQGAAVTQRLFVLHGTLSF
jgi:outer membrane receptor protein involved in Fe transport